MIFDKRSGKIIRRENKSNNATNDSGFIHLCTGARKNEVLMLVNDKLGLHFDAENNVLYQLTSLCILQNAQGQYFKGYGWSEDQDKFHVV